MKTMTAFPSPVPACQTLVGKDKEVEGRQLRELSTNDPARAGSPRSCATGLTLDYGQSGITDRILKLPFQLAGDSVGGPRLGAQLNGDESYDRFAHWLLELERPHDGGPK